MSGNRWLILFGKKKRDIAFLLGCMWYYIKRMEDIENATKATDFLVEICVKLGIDWDTVNAAERAYQTWDYSNMDVFERRCGLNEQ